MSLHKDASVPDGRARTPSLAETYHMYFDIVLADTDELREEAYRLRYEVYCVENAYEDPAENPGGFERDQYDENSVHALLVHRSSGLVAGTVRLILPSPEAPARSFPIQNLCDDPIFENPDILPIQRTAEISRFCVSKKMRRRQTDRKYPNETELVPSADSRRVIPNMMLGLLEAGVMLSVQNGVTHWCAEIEPALLRLLARSGIYFDPIGPLVDYHGMRQPCYIPLETMLSRTREEKYEVWELLTGGGAHLSGFGNFGAEADMALAI